jgi:hypothetical protein
MQGNITINTAQRNNQIMGWFLLIWTVLNIIQAGTLELQGDEAYYWMYSRYLDWGYFDHPPMVAVFIRIGDWLMHNELGLRLLTVLASTFSVWLLWLTVKKYTTDALGFALVVSSIFIFHIYGFTTTPDAPLFLFTALFYYFYQRYLKEDKIRLALILAVIVAGMFYSKYNAVLVIGFTVLSNIKLLTRGSFWFIAVLAALLYLPHILWQVNHGYPSVNYHLFERSGARYSFLNSLSYFPDQLLMAGPLVGWFFFYKAFRVKVKDPFIRCLLMNCIGTLAFFFISSVKDEVQPQWTYVLFAPLVMLTLIAFKQTGGRPKWLLPLASVNIGIIVAVRVIIILGLGFAKTYGHLKSYYGFKDWARAVKQKAGNSYVVMIEGFQNPSKYNYYTNSLKCFAYDTRYYRRTQFDIWPMEDSLQHKKIYYLTYYKIPGLSADSIKLPAGNWYGAWINDARSYQKVNIETPVATITSARGQTLGLSLSISNPYSFPISFSDSGYTHKVFLEACFFKGNDLISAQQMDKSFNQISLKPGESKHFTFHLTAPETRGTYELLFSLRTDPFPGGKNSRIITFTVK